LIKKDSFSEINSGKYNKEADAKTIAHTHHSLSLVRFLSFIHVGENS
jgi:hypothetical protein